MFTISQLFVKFNYYKRTTHASAHHTVELLFSGKQLVGKKLHTLNRVWAKNTKFDSMLTYTNRGFGLNKFNKSSKNANFEADNGDFIG